MPDVRVEQYDKWLRDDGPVALVIRQWLVPATQPDDIIFPPSYANPSEKKGDPPVYNIDGEGSESVCVLDSVPSQANRVEPIFGRKPYRELVPQIVIKFKDGLERSVLEIGHRIADAAFRGTELGSRIAEVLVKHRDGDSTDLAKLAPTSLVFGAWDSRGTQVKIPRLVISIVRAKDVVRRTRSAQYFPAISYEREGLMPDDLDGKPSESGLAEAPAVGKIGGVHVRGTITRDASLNLVALRAIRGGSEEQTLKLRRYILGLCVVALAAEPELDLRQGCLLTLDPGRSPSVEIVYRDGKREKLCVAAHDALDFATAVARQFGVGSDLTVDFNVKTLSKALASTKAAKKKRDGKMAPASDATPAEDGATDSEDGASA